MSIAMFIVGGGIFCTYVGFLVWNIYFSSRKNKEENYPGYYERHQPEQDELKWEKEKISFSN